VPPPQKKHRLAKAFTLADQLLPCFADTYSDMQGTEQTFESESDCFSAYTLASGATICFAATTNEQIGVDINGSAPPNIAGRDLFYFGWVKDGTLDEYSITDIDGEFRNGDVAQARETSFNNSCGKAGSYAIGCFGKILNDNWKMNY